LIKGFNTIGRFNSSGQLTGT